MADISADFLGIKSPNPYWLASAPPTDKQINVLRAFEAGWGGVVWKTLGSQIKNVSSRYSAVDYHGSRVMGLNNIELISDRPLDLNLREIKECIRLFPDRAMIVSLMADNDKESWRRRAGRPPLRLGSPAPASAASATGEMPRNSCSSGRPPYRYAPP